MPEPQKQKTISIAELPTASRLFEGVSPDTLNALEGIGKRKIYQPNDFIFHEGDKGNHMYVVMGGTVAITKTIRAGAEQLLDTLQAGDHFGEMGLIDHQERTAHAIAKEETDLFLFNQDDLDCLLAVSPRIGVNLVRSVSERLRKMNTRFVDQLVYQEKMSFVGQMAGTIIHDFKSPMTVVRLTAEMMGYTTKDEKIAKNCKLIMRNVDRITHMANDLMDFSRGEVNVECTLVEPAVWLDDVCDLLQPLLESRKVQLQRDLQTAEPLWLDPDKMTRVIYNLAVNSIDAMAGKPGALLTLRVQKLGDKFQIEVADTGNGIPEAIRANLFDAFVTYGKKNGTGLGTAIAKKIVGDHKGEISFTTETDKGTTFHIKLPAPSVSQPN